MVYTKSEADCDDCGKTIIDDGNVYCETCYDKLIDKISELEDKVNDLERQITDEQLKSL